MTAHDHAEIVPGCFRCEIGADETNPEPGPMTRDDLVTLLRAWGWSLTAEIPPGVQIWEKGVDEVLLPSEPTRSDYASLLRRAEVCLARVEGPRLLPVVREVAALRDEYQRKVESLNTESRDPAATIGDQHDAGKRAAAISVVVERLNAALNPLEETDV